MVAALVESRRARASDPSLPPLSPAEQAYFDEFVRFIEELPPDAARFVDELAECDRMYGSDTEAEIAAFHAGRHPFQQRR